MQERRLVASLTRSAPTARGRLLLGVAVAAGVVAADQVTKELALRTLADGPVHLVWTLELNLTYNRGAAFGVGAGISPVVVGLGVVVLVALLGFGRHAVRSIPATVALALVAGGAVGNLADRVLRDAGGAVVDFIDLGWWPVFNLADMAITVGAVLLILVGRP